MIPPAPAPVPEWQRHPPPSQGTPLPLRIAGLAVFGGMGFALALAIPSLDIKTGAVVGIVGMGAALLVVSGRPKELLFAGYILALTFNRQLFSFNDIVGNHGPQGLYWVPGDPLLLALVGWQLIERLIGRAQMPEAPPPPLFTAILPILAFLVASLLSAMAAERADWGFIECVRVVKFAFVLVWLQFTMTRAMWYAGLIALCLSVVLQSGFGLLQVAVGADSSLLSAIGLTKDEEVQNWFGEVEKYENRARGTLGHPNILGPYLLTLVPTLFGVLIYSRVRLIRLLALFALVVGLGAVFMTKSRSPIALIPFGLLAITVVALRERMLSLRLVMGTGIIAFLVLIALVTPFLDAINKRLTGDFAASVSFRHEYNMVALEIWDDSPLFGVGLNNFTNGLARHNPKYYQQIQELQQMRGSDRVRAIAPVHNVYLLILSEGGILGLAGLVLMLGIALMRFARAYMVSAGTIRGYYLGLVVGFSLECVQQQVDFSLWLDPYWYTLAVMIAMASVVPTLRPVVR